MDGPQKMIGQQRVQRRKLYEEVEHQLRELIVSGGLKPGDRLPSEHELMERYGVGRPAVREALLTLERQGFLRLRSGSPAVITRPSPAIILQELTTSVRSFMADEVGMRNLQAARRLIECALAREVAQIRTQADIERIAAALKDQEDALGDPHRYEGADVAFHTAIVRSVSNPIFESTQMALASWLLDQRHTTLMLPGRDVSTLAEHKAIFDAIEAGDADAAEQAMARHLERTVECYWAAVNGRMVEEETPSQSP